MYNNEIYVYQFHTISNDGVKKYQSDGVLNLINSYRFNSKKGKII